MSKILSAAVLGALSLVFLAGLDTGTSRATPPQAALPLPAIPADAPEAHAPRECDAARGVTTGCTYQ